RRPRAGRLAAHRGPAPGGHPRAGAGWRVRGRRLVAPGWRLVAHHGLTPPGAPRAAPGGARGRRLVARRGLESAARTKGRPRGRPFDEETGGVLLSRALAGQVPSALRGLTALFGMGRGVSPSLWPPKGCETGGPPPSPQNRTADRVKAGITISVKPSKH